MFFVHPDFRKSGVGRGLFEFVELELKRRGVQRWHAGCKQHMPADEFMVSLGFDPIETHYSKWIGV